MLWIFDPSNVQGRACSRFWIKTDVINKFWKLQITNGQKAFSLSLSLPDIGCGHIWDLTLVKGFNRGKKDVKNFTIVKLIS